MNSHGNKKQKSVVGEIHKNSPEGLRSSPDLDPDLG